MEKRTSRIRHGELIRGQEKDRLGMRGQGSHAPDIKEKEMFQSRKRTKKVLLEE